MFKLTWLSASSATLIVCYPVLALLSAFMAAPVMRAFALVCLATGILLAALFKRSPFAWSVYIAIIFSLTVAYGLALTEFIIKLPPLIILALVGSVFWRTLMPDNTPLVTDIGEKSRGPLSAAMRNYTLRVTQLWAAVLGIQLIYTLYLSIYGPEWLWALVTSLINYVLVITLFVAEFLYRKVKFPEHNHPGFIEYIRIVLSADVRKH